MKQHHTTLAFAESCTGGALSAQITAIPGASLYFLGSLVTYSNSLKEKILGVSPRILKRYGAVSSQTVKEMLGGLFQKTAADYGIAVSGIAGPSSGEGGNRVGTVWYAIGKNGEKGDVGLLQLKGTRKAIISEASTKLLTLLLEYLYTQPT